MSDSQIHQGGKTTHVLLWTSQGDTIKLALRWPLTFIGTGCCANLSTTSTGSVRVNFDLGGDFVSWGFEEVFRSLKMKNWYERRSHCWKLYTTSQSLGTEALRGGWDMLLGDGWRIKKDIFIRSSESGVLQMCVSVCVTHLASCFSASAQSSSSPIRTADTSMYGSHTVKPRPIRSMAVRRMVLWGGSLGLGGCSSRKVSALPAKRRKKITNVAPTTGVFSY